MAAFGSDKTAVLDLQMDPTCAIHPPWLKRSSPPAYSTARRSHCWSTALDMNRAEYSQIPDQRFGRSVESMLCRESLMPVLSIEAADRAGPHDDPAPIPKSLLRQGGDFARN